MKKAITAILLCAMLAFTACFGETPTEIPGDTLTGTPTEASTQTPAPPPTQEPSNNPPETAGPSATLSEDELLLLAEGYAAEMAANNFDNVEAVFTEEVWKSINPGELSEVYKQFTAELGGYIAPFSSEITLADGQYQASVVLEYERNGALILFVFTDDGSIGGLWLDYSSVKEIEAENNEVFEEIEIEVGVEPHVLKGLLTMPKNRTSDDVVILIQGSGQSDMDETIGASANKPLRDIAHGLAEQGIASVRYNKRYYQYPEQAFYEMTIEDEVMEDASAAIALVMSDSRTSGGKVIIAGHSLGGMLAPELAKRHPVEVKAIISLAGTPRCLEDVIYDQNCAYLDNTELGLSAEEIANVKKELLGEVEKIKRLIEPSMDNLLAIPTYYWYSLNKINTAATIQSLDIPMLILQGERDFQVSPDADYKMWEAFLIGKDNASFILYEHLNHLFMPYNGIMDIGEYDAASNVDPQVINDIAKWILSIK